MQLSRLLLLVGCSALLLACSSPEQRAARYLADAQKLFDEGDYVAAKLEAQNAAQIEPKNPRARLLLAKIAEQDQDIRAAVGHLLVVIESDPSLIEARTRLGLFYFLGGAEEQAAEQAAAAMEIAPEDARVRLLNAQVKYQAGDLDGAVSEAEYALNIDPAHVKAMMFLSGLKAESGDFDTAFAILDAGIERLPAEDSEPMQQFRVQLLGRAGRFDEVEAALEAIADNYPDDVRYKVALVQYYLQQDRVDEAIAMQRNLVAMEPDNVTHKINLVGLLADQQQPDQATATLQRFINEQPEEYRLQLGLGDLFESLGRMDEARDAYEALAAAAPLDEQGVAARNRLAVMDLRDNDLDGARARIDSTLADAPDNVEALIMRAAVSFADGDDDAVISDARTALGRDATSERALLLLARANLRQGQGVLAKDAYRRLIEINPNHPDASNELAALLANQGDPAAAQEILEARLEVDPEDSAAASGLIQTLLAQRDLEGAEAEARKLVDLNQNNALAQLQLGRVMQAKGSTEEAIAAYRATLDEDPQSGTALRGLVAEYMRNDRADDAIEFLQGFIAEHPDVLEARLQLGAVYAQQEYAELAMQEFEAVLDAQPKATRAYIELAALSPEDSGERESVYRRGLAAIPGNPQISLLLASQYQRQSRIDDAIEVYEDLLKTDPDNLLAINNLAALLLDFRTDESSHAKALELARKLETFDQAGFLDTVGWAYYRNGNYGRAVSFLERAVAQSGPVPVYRYHLGMAYAANQNPVGAKQELSQALENTEVDFAGIEDARATLAELNDS